MPPKTRKQVAEPRKRKASQKARDNQPKPPKKAKVSTLKVGAKKFIHPDDMFKEPTPESIKDASPVPPPLEDLSRHKFTLTWAFMLGSIEVAADSTKYQLGEFNYRQFMADGIVKVAQAAAKAKLEFEYISATGTLAAKGVTKASELKLKVDDEEGWAKAESFVEDLMRDKKKNVLMRLAFKYAKKCPEDASDSDDEITTKKKGKAMSQTQKAREIHRKQAILDGQHIATLVPLFKCNRPGCPNTNNQCYELDGVHLKLASAHFKTWSMSMNDGKADLETPPDGLIATLLVSKNGTFNPLRSGNGSRGGNSNVSSESAFSNISTPAPLPGSMYPYPQFPHFAPQYYNPFTPPHPQPQAPLQPLPPPIATPLLFSDSFAEEADPAQKLVEYIAWLGSRSPMQAPAFLCAQEALMEEGHTFKTLEKLSSGDFEKMGIKSGTATQLKAYIDLFKRKTLNHT